VTRRAYDRNVWRKAVRPAVLARDGYRCQVELAPGRKCGRLALEAGHRIALVDGGEPYQLGNLEAQCRHCNGADGGRIARRRAVLGRSSRRW
jgi:5-methylcytosine-specific restriction endonuclease McrA